VQPAQAYYEAIGNTLQRIHDEETEEIQKAGRLIGDSLAAGGLLHVFGTGGHSYIGGEEIFYRAGGLVPVNAILDLGVSLALGAVRSTRVERTPGYAKAILDVHPLKPGDVILVVNANGVNAVTIETALEARRRGLTVIAITSPACAAGIPAGHPARHPGNANLADVADLVLDSKTPLGEALVAVEGCDQKIGPGSTIANAFILHSIVVCAVQRMVELGVEPPVWKSANAPGGDEANRQHIVNYTGRLRHL
jgi:uncharacterized phosphosugar-binding protein